MLAESLEGVGFPEAEEPEPKLETLRPSLC